jgi:intracellular septation protein
MTPDRKPLIPETAVPWVRLAIDYGALIAFGVAAFLRHGIDDVATIVLMVASVIAVALGWILERRLAPLPVMAAVFSLVFGGLSLLVHDKRILKMKLTFFEGGMGAVMLVGLAMRKNPLKLLLGETFRLSDEAWRTLTLRYTGFFFTAAVANEIAWRNMSDMGWIWFKGAVFAAAVVFSIAQTPFLLKHHAADEVKAPEPPDTGF